MRAKLELLRNPECRECPLWEGNKTVCVPSRCFAAGGKSKALLVVGEAPGALEDERGEPFVGPSGEFLTSLYLAPRIKRPHLWNFGDYADIYIANAVRCKIPQNGDPTQGQINTCRAYLEADIAALSKIYSEIIVLCVGTTGTKSVLGMKVTKSFHQQGTIVDFDRVKVRVFSTYHPAILNAKRDPSKAQSIMEHLRLLLRYLEEGLVWSVPKDFPDPVRAKPVPSYRVSRLALDIETYGSVEDQPDQIYFHPEKMVHLDGVAPEDIVQTVGVAWTDPHGLWDYTILLPKNAADISILNQWLRKAREEGTEIVGQNLKFDLQVLRYCYPYTKTLLDKGLRLVDTSVLNYLHNELRPEKSLKDMSRLFGITEYKHTLKNTTFDNNHNKALWRYNIEDCLASYVLAEVLENMIQSDYGVGTKKLEPFARKWYSDLIWTTLHMSEAGVCMDRKYLEGLQVEHSKHMWDLADESLEKYESPLIGKGSGKAVDLLFETAAREAGLWDAEGLEFTKKVHKLKTDKHNMKVLLEALEPSETRDRLVMLSAFKGHRKLISSYLTPLLEGKAGPYGMSSLLVGNMSYSDWYPVPSTVKDDASDDVGGTIQCRMTCKRPGHQTNPQVIKKAITTRFSPGFLLVTDLSQIELRTAGLLSNDPVFMEVYAEDNDLHWETAVTAFGEDFLEGLSDEDKDFYRQVAKTTNFLMLYKGGAETLQSRIMAKTGMELPIGKCYNMIEKFYSRYPTLGLWQDQLIAKAINTGWIDVPLVGASRLFIGSEKVVERTYTNTICNLPIQATAANILISAQDALITGLTERGLKSVSGLQIYDSLFVEGPMEELEIVRKMVPPLVKNPPFFQELCANLERSIPIRADEKIEYRTEKWRQ